MLTKDMEKALCLKVFFPSAFTGTMRLQESQAPENRGKVCSKDDLLSVEQDLIREYLNKVISTESSGRHLGGLKGLASVIAGLLAILFEKSWQMLEVLITGTQKMSCLSLGRAAMRINRATCQ